ncbi:MAG: aminodeoxychorismate/anthranilate synthase component II [Lentisphaeria bacterium]|jgi:anthranilate synthase component 2|nr:aminodeoxychorismate/anthranilate synthase component II [Lentisphaeria bacterium]
MIFMLDNYDSFTFNLVQYLAEIGEEVVVRRNDEVSVEQVLALAPAGIVVSPGPCRPEGAGISIALIQAAAGKIPLLGVCLGHQAIGAAFGGKVVKAKAIMHGKVSNVSHDGKGVFDSIRSPMKATRYHSLAVERESLPACLEITAEAEDGEIMGLRHRECAVEGVQFHPESVLTPAGKRLLANFVQSTKQ